MRNIAQRIRQSLALKLSLGILLLTIPIFVASLGVLFLQSRNDIKEEARERAATVLNTTMHRLRRSMNAVETATEANAWYVREHMQPDSLLRYTTRIVALNGNVSGCSITPEPNTFPEYGRYFSAYSIRLADSIITVREGEYEYYEKPWYALAKRLGRACWTDPFDDFNEGTLSAKGLIASYCKPIYAADGHFMGVIATDLALSTLSQVINREKPYPKAYFQLLGSSGSVLVGPDSVSQKGASEAANFVCSEAVPGTSWTLKLVCPERDVLKSYYRLTYIVAPLIVIGLLLILLLCSRIVTHAIRPLNQLLKQSQLIASGHYDEQIARTDRQDAVGRLQNSFAQMQEALDRHIDDIKMMNEGAERRNEELVEAGRMAEESDRQKTLFIQNMSHQIRTPLNIIMGVSQLLGDGTSEYSREEVSGLTMMMNHNVTTLRRLVQMLYDSSDLGIAEELASHRHEEVMCNEIVREAISYTNTQFPEIKIGIQTTLPDTMTIHTSHLYLMRSLREILYNSAKYSDGKHISVLVTATDDTVLYIFEDRGPGIPDDYRDLMFVPFTKVNDLSEGLGLGLPLAKSHMKNLGGDLRLDDSYHDGCRFIIEVPLR